MNLTLASGILIIFILILLVFLFHEMKKPAPQEPPAPAPRSCAMNSAAALRAGVNPYAGLRHTSIYSYLPDVPKFGGGHPAYKGPPDTGGASFGTSPTKPGRPYAHLGGDNRNSPCANNLYALWLETDGGKYYPWDTIALNTYKSDRNDTDCELVKLLGESSYDGTPRRDRMIHLSVPDHLKLTG